MRRLTGVAPFALHLRAVREGDGRGQERSPGRLLVRPRQDPRHDHGGRPEAEASGLRSGPAQETRDEAIAAALQRKEARVAATAEKG